MERSAVKKPLSLVLLALGLTACGQAKDSFDEGVQRQFSTSFVSNCSRSAQAAGIAADKATRVCQCTVDKLLAEYEPSELMGMSPEQGMGQMRECAAREGLQVQSDASSR
jgi:hypothetical protein